MRKSWPCAIVALVGWVGCKDIDRFTTEGDDSYCGRIVSASMVRRGFSCTACMRMTFDARHVSDRPGRLWTDDGMFAATPLRPIPELSHDPLLIFNFGEGREKNFLFSVDPIDPARGPALTAVISLMHSGDTEVRLLRGAGDIGTPPEPCDSPEVDGQALFGVFAPLQRKEGNCVAEPNCAWTPEN